MDTPQAHGLAYVTELQIAEVDVSGKHRDPGDVQGLADSIREIGLLNPINVTPDGVLRAGRRRLNACKMLGWETIPANQIPLTDLRARLAEIDENLVRQELTALERSEQMVERKQIYETLYPQAPTAPGRHKKNAEIISAFSQDTANKAGVTPRTVRQEVQIATKLPEDVRERIRETPLADNKTELLKLARLPEEKQREVAAQIAQTPRATVKAAKQKVATAKAASNGKKPLPLPGGRYSVIVADPPWCYKNSGCRGAAENEYATMSVDEIKALAIPKLAADNCALFLWATWPQLPEAMAVMKAWGFTYVTGFPWLKIVGKPSVDLWGELDIKPQYGVGFWVRGCTEPVLIGRRGDVSPMSGSFVGILSENLRHSRKPENIYHIAETLPGPYLELFCRRPREGWTAWGNEVTNATTD